MGPRWAPYREPDKMGVTSSPMKYDDRDRHRVDKNVGHDLAAAAAAEGAAETDVEAFVAALADDRADQLRWAPFDLAVD